MRPFPSISPMWRPLECISGFVGIHGCSVVLRSALLYCRPLLFISKLFILL
ncbi:hypothetical protein GP5015_2173 [gamma proteobacterium HTCC5015]|nr:hypothetical protein GP5015_2173 [gamma proteobacterium HTCC5015]